MAEESLTDAFVETPIEDPVFASVVSLCDMLPACEVRILILDNFFCYCCKECQEALVVCRQAILWQKRSLS